MKNLFILLSIIFVVSCTAGKTNSDLNGNEVGLPNELKGLKVYHVNLGGLDYVKVAVLNGQVNSTTYPVGKTYGTTIIINNSNKVIQVSSIISENDSIIVARK